MRTELSHLLVHPSEHPKHKHNHPGLQQPRVWTNYSRRKRNLHQPTVANLLTCVYLPQGSMLNKVTRLLSPQDAITFASGLTATTIRMTFLTKVDCNWEFECRDVFHGGYGEYLYRFIIVAYHQSGVIAVLTDMDGVVNGTPYTCLSHPTLRVMVIVKNNDDGSNYQLGSSNLLTIT